MDNIVTYAETELAPFGQRPFSAVASLVLSRFAYFRLPAAAKDARGWEGLRIAELFRAVLKADSRSPQTIARSNLDSVHICDSGSFVAAFKHDTPVVHVLGGIWDNHRQTGRSR